MRHAGEQYRVHPAGVRNQTGFVLAKDVFQLLELGLAHAEKLPRTSAKVQRSGRLVFVVRPRFIVFDVPGNDSPGLFERLFGGVLAGRFFQFPHILRAKD